MTIQTIKEIEKGCGIEFKLEDYIALKICGNFYPYFKGIVLCPTCQAKLQQANEFLEMIEKNKLLAKELFEEIYGKKNEFAVLVITAIKEFTEELKTSVMGK